MKMKKPSGPLYKEMLPVKKFTCTFHFLCSIPETTFENAIQFENPSSLIVATAMAFQQQQQQWQTSSPVSPSSSPSSWSSSSPPVSCVSVFEHREMKHGLNLRTFLAIYWAFINAFPKFVLSVQKGEEETVFGLSCRGDLKDYQGPRSYWFKYQKVTNIFKIEFIQITPYCSTSKTFQVT